MSTRDDAPVDDAARVERIARALAADPACFDHPTEALDLVETHISWVVLTGPYAYKLKKAVTLPFLDFGTRARRKRFCEIELEVNRRLAPALYRDVVALTGTADAPRVGGGGPVLEWAVRMAQFDPRLRLDRVAAAGGLDGALVDRLATAVARMHERAPRAARHARYAGPARLAEEVRGNLEALAGCPAAIAPRATVDALARWSETTLARLRPGFRARKRAGRVRECHGDLHLANLALVDGEPTPFDCIEFDPALRWIDVASDLAFLAMDLDHTGHPRLARRLVGGWLEEGGDYEALPVLDHYLVYRALVRAKVALLRRGQCAPGSDAHAAAGRDAGAHVALAERYAAAHPETPIVLTCGVSGSGKSVLAGALAERTGAVRVRSDVERRRLHGGGGAYSAEATRRTYERLAEVARIAVESGRPAIVDATFLERARRERFHRLAAGLGVALRILDVDADAATLERRVAERARAGGDASEATVAVLCDQIAAREPLDAAERAGAVRVDTARAYDADAIAAALGLAAPRPG